MDVLVAFPVFVLLKMLDSSLLSSRAALAAAAPRRSSFEPCSGEIKRAGENAGTLHVVGAQN